MSDAEPLVGHIHAGCAVLRELAGFLSEFREGELSTRGRDRVAALVVAQLLDRYYTAAETLFLRVSQSFENHLAAGRWHSDLLEKMLIEIPRHRPAVITRTTYELLRELMRFRHFSRYYLELEFDWAKLDFLLSVFDRAHPRLMSELAAFRESVEELIEEP